MDEAGNREDPNFITFHVDSSPPVVKSTNLNEVSAGDEIFFDLSNTTDGSGAVESQA